MRRLAVPVSVALLVLAGGIVDASPQGTAESLSPPYDSAFDATRSECATGASCAGTADAADSGQVLATADYAREATTSGKESQVSWGGMRIRHRTAPGTKELTATFTWLVSAAADATGSSGDVFGQVWVETFAGGCGRGCTVTTDEVTVVNALSSEGVPVGGNGFPTEVTDERVTVTLTFTGDVPRWVSGSTTAVAAAVGYPLNTCLVDDVPTCDVDSGHAGTAHAEVDARLLSVTFKEA